MKRALCLLLICLFCTGCSALPPEERAFCVVLLVDGGAQECTVRVRIPTYQQNGGYQTLSATGATLTDALRTLESAAQMRLHWGQLRLIVLSRAWAAEIPIVRTLSDLSGVENPNIVLVAARGREVGEIGGRVVPSRGVALHNLEVVGLFQPSAVVVGRFARRRGGFVVVPVGRPPVADGNFHAAEVDDVAVRVAVDDDAVILVGVFDVFCDCQRQGAENHHQREKQSKVPFHEIASFYFMTSGS